jgi:hypothetical protein
MSTQISYRKGTAAQNDAFTGALAEITVDTTNKTLRVHDGATTGGSNIATVAYVDTAISSLSANSITDGTSNVRIAGANGSVEVAVAGTSNVAVFTASGITVPAIDKSGSNGVGNIGSSTNAFDTVFAMATSAQYADLAECYVADQSYTVGTVLVIGGNQEVTQSTGKFDSTVIGTVSNKPAYIMNSGVVAEHVAVIALTGRVPVRVVGKIVKGDLLATSNIAGVATAIDTVEWQPGCVFAKALESYDSDQPGIIEAVVGRF